MKIEFSSKFDHQFKKLNKLTQKKVSGTIENLLIFLEGQTSLRPGMGLKNFRGDYWEIRVDLRTRIIFELTDRIIFWFVGSHDDIRHFIKSK